MKAFKNKSEDFKTEYEPLSAASGDYGVSELRVQISFCVSQALLLNFARVGV